MKATIVIPTYNEVENIEILVKEIFYNKIENILLNILFVDDNSPDHTALKIKKLQKKYPIKLIERKSKLGIGSAYIIGFKKALEMESDFILEMDADMSHDPKDVKKLILACQKSADLSIGSRRVKGGKIIGWNFRRHLTSLGATWLSALILKLKTKDITSGFRCYKRKVLESINLDKIKSNGYAFQEEMLFRVEKANFKIKEIPVTFLDRRFGNSKLSKKDIIEFFLIIKKLRKEFKKTI